MPRTSFSLFAAAAAVATPVAAALSAVLAPGGAATTASTAAAITPAAATAPVAAATTPVAAVALSPSASIAALTPSPARSAAVALTPGALLATVTLPPGVRAQLEAGDRARRYLELCATDNGPLGPFRGLADAIAWMECGVRPDERAPFGPTPFDRVGAKIQEGCDHLAARTDAHPPDFDANDLLRLMYLYPPAPFVLATPTVNGAPSPTTAAVATPLASARLVSVALTSALTSAITATTPAAAAPVTPAWAPASRAATNRLPRDLGAKIRVALREWKYWIDEPSPCDQVYWSENHQVLFATAEYLAGQLMPDEWFPSGRMYGRDHKAKARPRLLRWLDERLKFGMNEWNSPGYYEEDFKALFNLVDFCDDPLVRRRAAMVIDLLIFDLARFTHQGSFGVTSGRAYEKLGGDGSRWKSDGWRQSVGELIEVLFGTRGRFVHSGAVGALYFATSSYAPPPVLLAIGKDRPARFVDRSRVSIDFDEAVDHGIGFTGLDDGMFWWAKSAYLPKQTVATTRWIVNTFGVNRLRHDLEDALGIGYGAFQTVSDGALRAAADAASPITEGMCLTKANLYTYRSRDVMLSSVQDYRRGQIGPQQHAWQATLGMKAVAFTTLPGKREGDGPGYWTGSAAMPSVVQHEGALVAIYDAPLITKVSEGLHRTHAWFPVAEFDEWELRRGSNLHGAWGVTSDGTWLLARKGDGYIGLYSNEGWEDGPTDWVARGSWTNVFVCQVGDAAEFGDFRAFKDRVTSARIYIHYPRVGDWSPVYCGYDIPGKARLGVTYGRTPQLNGQPYPVHDFPRYDNPYAYQPWGMPSLAIRHAGFELVHFRDTIDPQQPRGDLRLVR